MVRDRVYRKVDRSLMGSRGPAFEMNYFLYSEAPWPRRSQFFVNNSKPVRERVKCIDRLLVGC
jgi:hypothetical protein